MESPFRPAHPLGSLLLPPALAGALYWFFGSGRNIDCEASSALHVAALVGGFLGGVLLSKMRPGDPMAPVDCWLSHVHRMAGGGIALFSSSICVAAASLATLDKTLLYKEALVRGDGAFTYVLLSLPVAVLAAWALRRWVSRHLSVLVGLGITAVVAATWLASMAAPGKLTCEAVSAAGRTQRLPSMSSSIEETEAKVNGLGVRYLASEAECQLSVEGFPAIRIDSVPESDGDSKRCPRVEIRQSVDEVIGVTEEAGELVPIFSYKDGQLMNLVFVGRIGGGGLGDTLLDSVRDRAIDAVTVTRLSALTSEASTGRRTDRAGDLVIERDVSSKKSCRIEVRRGEEVLLSRDAGPSREGDRRLLCPDVDIHRANAVDITYVTIQASEQHLESSVVLMLYGGSVMDPPLRLLDLRGEFGPPAAWIEVNRIGVGAGIVILLSIFAELISARRWKRWKQGYHEREGRISLDEGGRTRIRKFSVLRIGPVILLGDLPPEASYRGAAAPVADDVEVLPGTLEDRLRTCRDRARLKALAAVTSTTGLGLSLAVAWYRALL